MKINPFKKRNEYLDYSPSWVRFMLKSGKLIAFILLIAFIILYIVNLVLCPEHIVPKDLVTTLPALSTMYLIAFPLSRFSIYYLLAADLIATIYQYKYEKMKRMQNF